MNIWKEIKELIACRTSYRFSLPCMLMGHDYYTICRADLRKSNKRAFVVFFCRRCLNIKELWIRVDRLHEKYGVKERPLGNCP